MKKGIYGKYIIQKADGSEIDPEAKYFVLRYDKSKHAAERCALNHFACFIQHLNPELSNELLDSIDTMLSKESDK